MRRASSLTVLQALGERVRAGRAARIAAARPRCRTRRGARRRSTRSVSSSEPGGARIAVARLADAAGVEQPLAARATSAIVAAARGVAGGRLALGPRQNDSATCEWPIERDALRLGVEAQLGEQRAEDVLPDRVARARVVQADALGARPRG